MKVKREDGITVVYILTNSRGKLSKSGVSPKFTEVLERVAETLPLIPPGASGVADCEDYGLIYYHIEY